MNDPLFRGATAAPAGGSVKRDVEPFRGRVDAGALWPFDENERVLGHFLPAERLELGARLQAEEIGMDQREALVLIDLHQGEGGARHLDRGIAQDRADQASGEGRLADAEPSGQGDEIAGTDEACEVAGETRRLGFAGHHDRP